MLRKAALPSDANRKRVLGKGSSSSSILRNSIVFMDMVTSHSKRKKTNKTPYIVSRCLECKRTGEYFQIFVQHSRYWWHGKLRYQSHTHANTDWKEASLGKIFCFTHFCENSFRSLASEHWIGNIFFFQKISPTKAVSVSFFTGAGNYSFAKTGSDRSGTVSTD